ncbi:type I restriction endonuclease subunit R, partial [Floridanema evergladense]
VTVKDAIEQYRHTRNPKETLLKFGRCLAHFAVDTDLIYMTTCLTGEDTNFLPFNQGNNQSAGNPNNPNGFKTAYLWEQILEKDSLLNILDNFVQMRDILDDKGKKTGKQEIIFPRYHQLDAVRKLVADCLTYGTGKSYLIQHSAGSGKSETIAWLALHLASLKNDQNQRVFNSILVITDRKNLDQQLQNTIKGFNHVPGTITPIKNNKSTQLAKALETGDDIIISTLQTFRFALEKITSLQGSRFAVIIDEAHSSESGKSKEAVKTILSFNNLETAEEIDNNEPDAEEEINQIVANHQQLKGRVSHVSYFAFTATPKPKTLETFGIPVEQPDGKTEFIPFSLYSMRQAIEENFILDVLQNYTTFKTYFKLVQAIAQDPKYSKIKAAKKIKDYADLHPHAIRSKIKVIVDHFHNQVADQIDGQAKAMIVTRSRLHAVRYKLEIDRYIKEEGYAYKALVAFTGGIIDQENPLPEAYTETRMNGIPESQTTEAFKGKEYRFLIVAKKFQTGFNQPLLQTMYVDKPLKGVEVVQTLSRLNRIHPNKNQVFVLDFMNETDEIQKVFQTYYQATILSEATDQNKLYDLQYSLESFGIFTTADVENLARVYFPTKENPQPNQANLHPILNPIADKFKERSPEEQALFRKKLGDYVSNYAFLVQVITFSDVYLEKLYQFARFLLPKVRTEGGSLAMDISDRISMDSYRIQQTSTGQIKLLTEDGELVPFTNSDTSKPATEKTAPLSEILDYINKHFDPGDLSDADKLNAFAEDMTQKLEEKEDLIRALDPTINPSEETRELAFETVYKNLLEEIVDENNFDIYQQLTDNPSFVDLFIKVMFKNFQKHLEQRQGLQESG